MIVDTSALLAILFREPDAARFEASIAKARRSCMSVANALEATMVIEGRGGAQAGGDLDEFLERSGIELGPVTTVQLKAARDAWRRFGKGNHAAGSTSGIASPMRWPMSEVSRCCSRGRTSNVPISHRR